MIKAKVKIVKSKEEIPKPKSPWFCDSPEAIEHKKNCKKNPWNCGKCVWIDESANAMGEYGAQIVVEEQQHPLYDMIVNTFGGREVN